MLINEEMEMSVFPIHGGITLFKLWCKQKNITMLEIRNNTGLSFNTINSLWSSDKGNRLKIAKLLSMKYKLSEEQMLFLLSTFATKKQIATVEFKFRKAVKLTSKQKEISDAHKESMSLHHKMVRDFIKGGMSYKSISEKYAVPLRRCKDLILNKPTSISNPQEIKTKKIRNVKSANITLFRAWCIRKKISLQQVRNDCHLSESLVLKCFNSDRPKSNSTVKLLSMQYKFKDKEMERMLTTYSKN